MDFHILVEDSRGEKEFLFEHGLSVYFEADGKRFLMDAGQSKAYLKNAEILGIDLTKLDYIVFSHGHYDHTGGIRYIPKECNAKIIAHPDYSTQKYDGERYIGMPQEEIHLEEELSQIPVKLSENVFFLGEIPGDRKPYGEYIGPCGEKREDNLFDDSAIAVNRKNSLIILCGCAHSGIINIVKYAQKICGKKETTIIGGLHLLSSTEEETKKTIDDLKTLNVSKVFCGHCTGEKACDNLIKQIGGEKLFSGKKITI